MKTKCLYETNSHLNACEARVLECKQIDGHYEILLSQTVFFPEQGGQPADNGAIGDAIIYDVKIKESEIYHLAKEPLPIDSIQMAKINFKRRFDFMQQHSGEHLLSYSFWKLYQADNVGFHLGIDSSTIDLNRPMTKEELREAEIYANRQVYENRPVSARVLSLPEFETIMLRKKAEKAFDAPRVVEIEGSDRCTCCAPHVRMTGEIGLIKIIRASAYKGGTRVEFLCGERALLDYEQKNEIVLRAGALLSTKDSGILEGIERLETLKRELGASLQDYARREAKIQAQGMLEKAASVDGQKIIVSYEERNAQEVKWLMEMLTDGGDLAALLLYHDKGRLFYLMGKSKENPSNLKNACKELNEALGAKGGGNDFLCQGSAPFQKEIDLEVIRTLFHSSIK